MTEISCPLYLLTSLEPCWKCGLCSDIVAIGTLNVKNGLNKECGDENRGKLFLLKNVTSMPLDVFKYIEQRNSRYMKRHFKTAGSVYYANSCECGANFGDFYLYTQLGGAFNPETESDASFIKYHEMPFSGAQTFVCGYSECNNDLILSKGEKEMV